MTETDAFVVLVSRVTEKCFQGRVPARECDTDFVAAMLICFQNRVPDFKGVSPEVLNRFAAGLVVGIDCLRREQDCAWRN